MDKDEEKEILSKYELNHQLEILNIKTKKATTIGCLLSSAKILTITGIIMTLLPIAIVVIGAILYNMFIR